MAKVTVKFVSYSDHVEALLFGGWFTGRGKSPKAALENLVNRLNGELNYFGYQAEIQETNENTYIQLRLL